MDSMGGLFDNEILVLLTEPIYGFRAHSSISDFWSKEIEIEFPGQKSLKLDSMQYSKSDKHEFVLDDPNGDIERNYLDDSSIPYIIYRENTRAGLGTLFLWWFNDGNWVIPYVVMYKSKPLYQNEWPSLLDINYMPRRQKHKAVRDGAELPKFGDTYISYPQDQ